jgi:calcineurin-like phosphoesterase family protein
MYFFTADEHFCHANIIKYCNRPFDSVEEMDKAIIDRHNSVVQPKDTVIHVGDFCMSKNRGMVESIVKQLKGKHIFLRGSHDYWLNKPSVYIDTGPIRDIWEQKISIGGQAYFIIACHYAMREWPKSYYNSWQLYGHSHGRLKPIGKQMDVGVDTHNFYPYSMKEIVEEMKTKPDNQEFASR